MSFDRYPLAWPTGWARTPRADRQTAHFGTKSGQIYKRPLTVADAVQRLLRELDRLGVESGDALLSTNIKVRLDGLPYSNQPEPGDTGAAVYFRLHRGDRVLACDRWTRVADNVAAIAAHVEAIRAIARYGVGSLDQAFAGYSALPAKGQTWRTTLGFPPDAIVTRADVEAAFRQRARDAHPDNTDTGSHDAMTSLTAARAEAFAEVSQ